jgi:hypothetical protein
MFVVHPNNIAMRKNTYLAEVKVRVKAVRKLSEQEIERIISLLKEGKPLSIYNRYNAYSSFLFE